MMVRLSHILGKALGVFLAVLLCALVVLTLLQIVSRYTSIGPGNGMQVLSRMVLIWLGVLSGVYCVYLNAHVGFTAFTDRMSPSVRRIIDMFVRVVIGALSIALLIFGGMTLILVTHELGQKIPILGLPFSAVYTVLPIAGVLTLIFVAFPRQSPLQADSGNSQLNEI